MTPMTRCVMLGVNSILIPLPSNSQCAGLYNAGSFFWAEQFTRQNKKNRILTDFIVLNYFSKVMILLSIILDSFTFRKT